MNKNYAFVVTIILLTGISFGYFTYFYESPEDCFVREMKEWSSKKELTESVKSITQEDSKMAVARAKAIAKEFDYGKFNDDSKKIYLQTTTLFEYCGIKY